MTPSDHKLTGQQQVVLDYLMRGRTLTNKVALTCLGVGSLSSRIAELRKMGFEIVDSFEEDQLTGRLFKKYNIGAHSVPG
jgi:hypothetical protein